jgi:rabconnectin-3b
LNCQFDFVIISTLDSNVRLDSLYLIPGSASRITRICLGEDNLLLVYADGRARLWDVKTQEFWRSMTTKAVDELLTQGAWFEV